MTFLRKRYIKKGSVLETATGYITISGFNGSVVDVNETVLNIDDDGNETETTNDARYTLNEIAALLHNHDGHNYRVIFE